MRLTIPKYQFAEVLMRGEKKRIFPTRNLQDCSVFNSRRRLSYKANFVASFAQRVDGRTLSALVCDQFRDARRSTGYTVDAWRASAANASG
jgi:hypothetical protein